MPPTPQVNIFESEIFLGTLKATILLILILYAFFAIIIIRQVDLMSKALITGISPIFKLITMLHAILSLALIVLAWGIL